MASSQFVEHRRDPQKNEEAARQLWAAGFFQKPPEIDRLIAAIHEQISKPEPQDRTVVRLRKILVVEDDADTRMGLIVRLRKAGYDTAFAADAATVLTVAMKENPAW